MQDDTLTNLTEWSLEIWAVKAVALEKYFHLLLGLKCYLTDFKFKLDFESIMSSPRLDFEKEWISIIMVWDFKILNFTSSKI